MSTGYISNNPIVLKHFIGKMSKFLLEDDAINTCISLTYWVNNDEKALQIARISTSDITVSHVFLLPDNNVGHFPIDRFPLDQLSTKLKEHLRFIDNNKLDRIGLAYDDEIVHVYQVR